jgi:hypothetical protein
MCHTNLYNAMNVSLPSLDMNHLRKIKHDNLNQISGLKEISVILFSRLISGSQNLRNYSSHQKRDNVHKNCKEGNEHSSISDHSNCICSHSLFSLAYFQENRSRAQVF